MRINLSPHPYPNSRGRFVWKYSVSFSFYCSHTQYPGRLTKQMNSIFNPQTYSPNSTTFPLPSFWFLFHLPSLGPIQNKIQIWSLRLLSWSAEEMQAAAATLTTTMMVTRWHQVLGICPLTIWRIGLISLLGGGTCWPFPFPWTQAAGRPPTRAKTASCSQVVLLICHLYPLS